MRSPWRRLVATLVVVPVLALPACGSPDAGLHGTSAHTSPGHDTPVVISGQQFTEMLILQQMYSLVLADAGYRPTVRSVATRDVYAAQLSSGAVQVSPDYLSAMTEHLNRLVHGVHAAHVSSH